MMVLAFQREKIIQKTKSFPLKRMFEVPGRQVQSLILDSGSLLLVVLLVLITCRIALLIRRCPLFSNCNCT
uniref:Uncharacterized protein n=1 Tax=Rhizophora mucronata TaxID=61149 RepID=A0A2P2PNG4_RHIMU